MNGKLFDVVLRGYSREQVDALYAQFKAKKVTGDEVRESKFDVVWRGYDRHQVEATLGEWAAKLDGRSEK